MAAISQLSRWLSGNNPVWKYTISQAPPEYIEQYHAHLGEHITFNAQVAERLNFSDTSNFRRAFIRWTGITPTLLSNCP